MAQTCYMCEAPGPTREHVPPQRLFPEQKDTVDGHDRRKNLITVPSCELHNTKKSHEDQYFIFVLESHFLVNEVGEGSRSSCPGTGGPLRNPRTPRSRSTSRANLTQSWTPLGSGVFLDYLGKPGETTLIRSRDRADKDICMPVRITASQVLGKGVKSEKASVV